MVSTVSAYMESLLCWLSQTASFASSSGSRFRSAFQWGASFSALSVLLPSLSIEILILHCNFMILISIQLWILIDLTNKEHVAIVNSCLLLHLTH